ncbi:MAG TPA: outer membrane beta-barrel protein [Gemmatimonadaceae bacterium]|nr:outer membrane beta-barrel protein [Gemmatimonadaceae bacterium]
MNQKLVLLPALLLGLVCASASSAAAQKSYALGVAGGAAIPTGKFGDSASTGYNVTAFIALGVPELPLGVRLDGVFNNFNGRTVLPPGGGAEIETPRLRVMGAIGNLIYTFSGTTAKPYIIAGGGIYNIKADTTDARSKNEFGFNGGVGATFGLRGLAGFIEARYHGISRGAADGGNVQFVPVTLGLMF